MPSDRGVISTLEYAHDQVEPYVKDMMHKLRLQFTCGTSWTRQSQSPQIPDSVLSAAPLPADASKGHGYGRRTGAAITVDVIAKAELSKYTWNLMSNWPVRQGPDTGSVYLTSSMHVRFGIESGTQADQVSLPDGSWRNSFLCWADTFVLPDGSTCIGVKSFPGDLWLRPFKKGQKSLVRAFNYDFDKIVRTGHAVVQLVQTGYNEEYPNKGLLQTGYWSGFQTRDTSGRVWCIQNDTLNFGADMRLEVVGRYNNRLKGRTVTELMPPYEAIWSPHTDDEETRLYIPFTLS